LQQAQSWRSFPIEREVRTMSGQTAPVIFLSHSGVDTEPAKRLKQLLLNSPDAREAGLRVWFDKDDLRPGESWSAQIAKAIENEATSCVVYVGSGGVVNWVDAEVDLALSRAITDKSFLFIPVLTAEGAGSKALPSFARRYQGVSDPLNNAAELGKLLKAILGLEWDQAVRLIEEPFVGLRSMGEDEVDRFFGRTAEIEVLVEKFRRHRIVAIVADSGAGKSSLAAAGFAPAFRGGRLSDPARDDADERVWHVVTMRPRDNPEEGLRLAVTEAAEKLGRSPDERASLRRRLAVSDPSETAYALQCDLPSRKTATLLIVDQFEELFTATPDARTALFANLLSALADGGNDIRILLTVRADYFNLLSDIKDDRGQPVRGADGKTLFEHLTADGGDAILRLRRISEVALSDIVCKPLRLAGESDQATQAALLTAVQRDISDQPSDLPLLQVALKAAWREHKAAGKRLLEAYESSGGVLGALAKEAEKVRNKLSTEDQARLESIFVRLVWLGDTGGATRRTAALKEFDGPRQALLRRLGDDEHGRLVVVGEASAEIAHEALITQWPWLQGRLKDDARDVRRLDRLMSRSPEWNEAPEDAKRSYLAYGAERDLFGELTQKRPDWLSPDDKAFVAESIDAKRADDERKELDQATLRRRVNQLVAAAVALVVALGAVAYYGLAERRARHVAVSAQAQAEARRNEAVAAKAEAENETRKAIKNQSVALTALAATEATRHPVIAAKLALAAWPRDSDDKVTPKLPAALDVLGQVVADLRERVRIPSTATFASFSPDGSRIVTALNDATARIWDAVDGHEIATLKGHAEGVTFAAFSPDGETVITTSKDKTARLWDVGTGRQIAPPMTHGDIVTYAAFSPDGRRVVTASEDGFARIWNASTGAPIAALRHGDNVTAAAFSPDGQWVLTASTDTTARIWDAANGSAIATLKGHDAPLNSAAFSADGGRVVTASDDTTARIWDAASGLAIATLKGHGGPLASAAFSPDGTRVVTSADDTTARIWDAADGHEIATLKGHDGPVTGAAFSFDGKWVTTASADLTARIWDAVSGREIARLKGHDGTIFSAAFNNNATRVITASSDGTTRIWDATPGRSLRILQGHSGNVTFAAFSRDGGRVVTASDDRTVRVWDAADGRAAATLTGHEGPVKSAAFSPDGTRIVTGSDDETARLWDAASGRALLKLAGHESWVASAAFSPDGTRIVTGSGDKTARVWDAASGRSLVTLLGHAGPVNSAAFSPDGGRVVTASDDRTARLWNAASGEALVPLAGHEKEVTSAAFSSDGSWVVTASWDKTARIWDAANGREIAALKSREGELQTAAFSPDGTRIVTVSENGTVLIWDAASRREIATLRGHSGRVFSAAFSADGRQVVTGSQDRTARIWDVSSIPKGNILVVACSLLPDENLDNLISADSPENEKPICGPETPGPDPASIGAAK
jgi:WD40 repeat protein